MATYIKLFVSFVRFSKQGQWKLMKSVLSLFIVSFIFRFLVLQFYVSNPGGEHLLAYSLIKLWRVTVKMTLWGSVSHWFKFCIYTYCLGTENQAGLFLTWAETPGKKCWESKKTDTWGKEAVPSLVLGWKNETSKREQTLREERLGPDETVGEDFGSEFYFEILCAGFKKLDPQQGKCGHFKGKLRQASAEPCLASTGHYRGGASLDNL